MRALTDEKPILVIGAGSWGTAVAIHLARIGHHVLLWGRSAEHVLEMQEQKSNPRYLPDCPFPGGLSAVHDLTEAVRDCKAVFCMTPSKAFSEILHTIQSYYPHNVPFIWGAKGFAPTDKGLHFLHEVVKKVLGNIPSAVLSGPTFAIEVARQMPTALVLASETKEIAAQLQLLMHSTHFRVYTSTDLVGVQLCGGSKNIFSVAAGIADGMELGANTRSALITRSMVEVQRVAKVVGCQQETMMGLSGMGDLILTCTSDLSRNRRFGLALGAGASLEQAQKDIGQVVESMHNVGYVLQLAKEHALDLPIAQEVYKVLTGKESPDAALHALLTRAPKAEFMV